MSESEHSEPIQETSAAELPDSPSGSSSQKLKRSSSSSPKPLAAHAPKRSVSAAVAAKRAAEHMMLRPVTLRDEFKALFDVDIFQQKNDAAATAPASWIANLTVQQLFDIINESDTNGAKLCDFETLSRLASVSQIWFLLFNMKQFDLWNRLTAARMERMPKGDRCPVKFGFVEAYFHKRQLRGIPPCSLGALKNYLNAFGTGFCEHCSMYPDMVCETHLPDDSIPIAAFRTETAKERKARIEAGGVDELDNDKYTAPYDMKAGMPSWLKNFLSIRNNVPVRYYCANIRCNKLLDQEVCGMPLAGVFHACETKRGNKGHSWRDLPNDLTTPGGEVIDKEWNYCIRCGVLQIVETEHDGGTECGFCDGDDEGNCVCEPCELCERMPNRCKCTVCSECELCNSEVCRLCEDRDTMCTCDASSSSASSSAASGSSSSSSSDSSD
jgi:hypothetical protein